MKTVIYIVISFLLVSLPVGKIYGQNPPEIRWVTVDHSAPNPGAVNIVLDPSGTTPTSEYIIYRFRDISGQFGDIPIDTVPNGTVLYTDNTAIANMQSELYKVASIDNGSVGSKSEGHATIFLEIEKNDSCNKTHSLKWNEYVGINNGLVYNLNTKRDGSEQPDVGIIPGATTISYNIEFNSKYEYYIRARSGVTIETRSNIVIDSTQALKNPDPAKLYINQIDNSGSEVTITCNIDLDADLLKHTLFAKTDALSDYFAVDSVEINSDSEIILSHNDAENFYKVSAISTCKVESGFTNNVKPILLTYNYSNQILQLNWNESYIESLPETYNVNISIDGSGFQILETSNNTNYELNLNTPQYSNNEYFCLNIDATNSNNYKSFSNTICVSKQAQVIMYNAFTPNGDGKNDFIGPTILNADIISFEFIVYNKFGEAIYHSTNYADSKWNGTYKGFNVSEGAYLYYLKFKTRLDQEIEKSGDINVVYP